jgi:site-specific recombinase XerD
MMNQLTNAGAAGNGHPGEPRRHVLGQVEDDWHAVEIWLAEVQAKNANGSTQTVDTYRFHLAKLRWYCDYVGKLTPSNWSAQDVAHFRKFLTDLPVDARCATVPATDKRSIRKAELQSAQLGKRIVALRYVDRGEPGWTPFHTQPSTNSQSDMLRFVHAMFSAWYKTGYLPYHPMGLSGAPRPRRVNVSRAVSLDLYDLVLAALDLDEKTTPIQRQRYLRDRFIFLALRWLGLRSSELVKATMSAFRQVPMPGVGDLYWIFTVTEDTGKGGVERNVPVVRELWDALVAYRVAFGLAPAPSEDESTRLLLSMRTTAVVINEKQIKETASRRYFGAWLPIETRQGLYMIVKERLRTAADALALKGNQRDADRLAKASSHWFRHTFGKAALLSGQSAREVTAAMGHADSSTTDRYTVQDALDLILAWERERPGSLAKDIAVQHVG